MKPNVVLSVSLLGLIVALAVTSHNRPALAAASSSESQIQKGFAIAPVHLDLRGRNRALVGLGSYIVNAQGGCNDCHTAPPYSKDPYAFVGAPKEVNADCYLAGGTPFGPPGPDTPVSRNITPFEDGKPAGLTFEEFVHVMRTGEDPDAPGHVLEVMPWPVYGDMTLRDLRAVYEYLSTIPPQPTNKCGVPSEP